MTQAVILAGGKGTRLAERLRGRPKPLVEVDGIPLLERQIQNLAHHGVDDVVVLVNHAADQIQTFFDERQFAGRVRLIDDGAPRGTAGAVLACLDQLADRFLVVYGDTLFDIDVDHMQAFHQAAGAAATLLLHPNDHPADSDLVELDPSGQIRAFHPYPHPDGAELRNLVNAAFYILEKAALQPWRKFRTPSDFAKDLFPEMLAGGARLEGYVSYEYIKDLGTPRRLDKVERHLREGVVSRASRAEPQKAVFIDRDGTLNRLEGYIREPQALELLPGAAEAVRRLNDAEFRVVVVTNQPVIARGECTVEGLRNIHDRLETRLGEEGAYLDAIYYCPHHPDSGFPGEVKALKIACDCRKPAGGLLREAIGDMNIRPEQSWMVGDSTSDIMAAQSLSLKSILVRSGEGGADGKHFAIPDFTLPGISEAAEFITEIYPRLAATVGNFAGKVSPGDLVLVGGLARSGKSTLAGVLRAELMARNLSATIISLDRWIRPEALREPGVLGRFDLQEARAALSDWLAGAAAQLDVPEYDRCTRTRKAGGRVPLSKDGVLILEGVPALLGDWPTPRNVQRIYMNADESLRRDRVIDDLISRGLADTYTAVEVYAQRQADEAVDVTAGKPAGLYVYDFDNILAGTPT